MSFHVNLGEGTFWFLGSYHTASKPKRYILLSQGVTQQPSGGWGSFWRGVYLPFLAEVSGLVSTEDRSLPLHPRGLSSDLRILQLMTVNEVL